MARLNAESPPLPEVHRQHVWGAWSALHHLNFQDDLDVLARPVSRSRPQSLAKLLRSGQEVSGCQCSVRRDAASGDYGVAGAGIGESHHQRVIFVRDPSLRAARDAPGEILAPFPVAHSAYGGAAVDQGKTQILR